MGDISNTGVLRNKIEEYKGFQAQWEFFVPGAHVREVGDWVQICPPAQVKMYGAWVKIDSEDLLLMFTIRFGENASRCVRAKPKINTV